MNIYRLTEKHFTDTEVGNYTAYGVDVCGADSATKRSVSDIFTDKAQAQRFVKECNEYALDPVHLDEAIENELVG